jgi:hypothetical protein
MDALLESSEYSDEVKFSIRLSIESFAGSMEPYRQLRWICVEEDGGAPDMEVYPSFAAYLQTLLERLDGNTE